MFAFIFTSELVSPCGYIQCSPQAGFGEWDLPSARGFGVNPRKDCLERELSASLHVWKNLAVVIPLSNSPSKQAHILFWAVEIPDAPRVSNHSHHLAPNNGIYWCFLSLRVISKQVLWASILFLFCPLKESSTAFNPSQTTSQSWEMVYSWNIFSYVLHVKKKTNSRKCSSTFPPHPMSSFVIFKMGWFDFLEILQHTYKNCSQAEKFLYQVSFLLLFP